MSILTPSIMLVSVALESCMAIINSCRVGSGICGARVPASGGSTRGQIRCRPCSQVGGGVLCCCVCKLVKFLHRCVVFFVSASGHPFPGV
ncbi:hypothetical protein GDO86_003985 [Hymenochirus boettgeri]|uniref:Secreted protein n=1 Tax=Hymenochirus boettgeri TaxID=247094 RepID=A0A8T2K8P7_9PIPI|nr:hypothetical protein GDO86_003985 [Hymenochirus boettgeri]